MREAFVVLLFVFWGKFWCLGGFYFRMLGVDVVRGRRWEGVVWRSYIYFSIRICIFGFRVLFFIR